MECQGLFRSHMHLNALEEMICVESRYFNINRILLLTVGLWPYAQSKLVRTQLILLYGILTSFIVFQLMIFVTSRYTLQYAIKILSVTSLFIFYIIQYSKLSFNMDVVKHLFILLQCTYNELRDESEVAIIEKYWNIGRRYTEMLTLLAASCIIAFILSPFLPQIFAAVLSGNESRLHISLQIVTDYSIDQERYFYLIMLYTNIAFCIGILALLATGTMCITYVQHICGMLRIASYRMERIMKVDTRSISAPKSANLIYMGIVYAVDMHRKAIKFIKIFIFSINKFLFFLIMDGLLTASLNLYQIFQELSFECSVAKIIQHSIFLTIYYIYTFVANYCAQQIMDHNNHIFATVYNVQWYIAPLHIQKLILFLLQRGTKTFENLVIIGGLFIGSLEGFATLVSTSVSYFTFLYSTKQ
ncbi:odorant receptor 47a-like [Camponotus floridanus]|uniref:odorant receptor 47a-like n=1 Tax=Camponotus floridanus TaxID=104421 RepID=UPI000DC6CD43|nr:odorant receptor 47a-like [Camponotus floridanus]